MLPNRNQARSGSSSSAGSVWVPDLVQGRFHNLSPGDLGSTFIVAGESETKQGLRIGAATGESFCGAALFS